MLCKVDGMAYILGTHVIKIHDPLLLLSAATACTSPGEYQALVHNSGHLLLLV